MYNDAENVPALKKGGIINDAFWTWSRGKKFAFDVNVKVNGSIIQTRDLIEQTTSLTLGNRLVSKGFQTQLACFR